MLDVPVLDAHVHVWDPRTTPRTVSPALTLFGWNQRLLNAMVPVLFPRSALAFVGSPRYVLAPWTFADHHAEGHASLGFIHVEAAWKRRNPARFAEETRWLEALGEPTLRGIVAHADLAHPGLDALLDAHAAASSRVCGIRDKLAHGGDTGAMSWTRHPHRMDDPAWRRGFARLGERGLVFDAWCYAHQLPALVRLVREIPTTRVVLDHLGTPVDLFASPERSVGPWHDALAALAESPQVAVKVSGLTMPVLGGRFHERQTTAGELVERLGPHVGHVLRVFGADRCVFASNFPMDRVSVNGRTLYAAYDALTREVPDRRGLFAENALRLYGLAGVAASP